jgi:oligopeptide/dipeptide ABC transporter ATP-binding protein
MAGPAEGRIRHPVLRAFVRAPGGLIGAGLLLGLLVLAVVGPMIWGHPATVTDLNVPYQVHSPEHPLGTDSLGRDVLARTLSATRLTLVLGLSAAAISAVVGFGIGTAVAALGPRARGIGRRAIESSLSFPPILLALFLVAIIGAGARGAVIAIGLGAAPGFARLAENFATSVGSREFIASAKATGVGRARLIQRYLLPNMAEPLVLAGLAYVAGAIIDISGLDFLGLGVQPPAYDWGTLLTAGVQSIYVTPFAGIAPAFMIMLTGTSLVFFGEALSRALNPRLWVTGPRRGGRAERARAGRAGKAGLAGPAAARPAPATGAADPVGPVVADAVVADAVVADPVVADAVVADAVVVENLRITLPSGGGPRALVDGVSFRLRAGEVLGIVGESGSGKTLTSLAIGQLLPHPLRMEATRIELGGTELTTLPPGRLARVLGTGLAMIFQDPMSSMNPASRAGSQLTDGARRHRGLSREEARAEAVQRLGEVRIGDARRALRRYPHQFSGGMQQRIMIAMGLMARPRVLIADEPTTALDVTVQAQVLEVLRDINASEGTAIILISHNLGVINQLCDRVLVMYAGRVVEEGDRERLLADPQHPYTKALLASVPVLPGTVLSGTSPAAELSTIPGRPPRPDEDVPGCSFAARCPLAVSRCAAERPALSAAAAGGKVACFAVTGATTGEAVR